MTVGKRSVWTISSIACDREIVVQHNFVSLFFYQGLFSFTKQLSCVATEAFFM